MTVPEGAHPSRRRLPAGLLLTLAGLVVCLRYLLAEIARLKGGLGFPLDDSWIHLEFARNLARGLGLSYNPGHLVTGSTAPLWTALLSLLFLLPGSVIAWTKALGIALHLAGIAFHTASNASTKARSATPIGR